MDKPATAGGDTARVWTIAPGDAFLPRLARALIDGALIGEKPSAADQAARSASPFALAEATVLLPTRRACRALGDALVEANGGAPLLLPAIRALGDVDLAELALQGGAPGDDELAADFPDQRAFADLPPPAIGALERVVTLGRLIEAWGEKVSPAEPDPTRDAAMRKPGSAAMAVRLAGDLAHFMDSLETEGIDPARLAEIVPEGFSRHWQVTLDFLQIVSGAWPEHLGQRGLISPAARRDLLLAMETRRLARLRPAAPVIAAGSTGSIPATADLLGTIARLPAGAVVLPGLDLDSDEGDWSGILAAPSHPQHGMALLLARIGVSRDQVRALGAAPRASRAALAREAMRPAPRTDSWHLALDGSTPHRLAGAGQGLTLIAARTIEEEALAIALAMRECIETAGQSAALITPDRALARRVAAELGRWNLTVDDSAGISLAATPPGLFARLVAEIMCEGLRPVPLLALLKHPLAGLGMAPAELRRAARILEIAVLRGPRLAPDLAALRTRLAGARANSESGADRDPARARLGAADWELAGALVERLAAALAASGMAGIEQSRAPLAELFARHRALCENFAGNERTGGSALSGERLYAGPAGAALRAMFDAAAAQPDGGWRVAPGAYPALFTTLISGQPVRPQGPAHPRLHILGLLEARLLSFDRIILAGLNENIWPGETAGDPWLSRPMRDALGLPPPERRIGLAAHDFAQGFAAPEVILTRADRRDGDPCGESRWLLRLRAVDPAGGILDQAQARGDKWLAVARALDATAEWAPAPAPRPRPPLALRPRRLSVTEIETWNRDPYAIYARHVLKLAPLEALDQGPSAADRGTIIHAALQRFIDQAPRHGGETGEQAARRLMAIGAGLFETLPDAPEIKAFWWRRFVRAARWFAETHAAGSALIAASFTERRGEIAIPAPAGTFTLSGRADRIDLMGDGTLEIIDYKTGTTPSPSQVESGLIPQLSLEAAIAEAGGFAPDGIGACPVARLAYISLSGAEPPGKIADIATGGASALGAEALAGLTRKIAAFDNEAVPYLSRPHPMFASRYADYDHLARVKEWARDAAGESQ